MTGVLSFDGYQHEAGRTAIYPGRLGALHTGPQYTLQGLQYVALGLNGEAGEIADIVKKVIRDGTTIPIQRLTKEAGDVAWYLSELCTNLALDLSYVLQANIDKLADRKERGVLSGSGDER
jgi:NTP pyrophosphatase (non-canonical NTP hydrolase)